MSFRPAFDVSTLYYADRAIQWLCEPGEMPVEELLAKIRQLQMWSMEAPEEDAIHLNRAVAQLYGFVENSDGSFDYKNIPVENVAWHGRGGQLLRLLFGLLCLSRVVDAICLGEDLHYIPGTSVTGFSMNSIAPRIFATDQGCGKPPLWKVRNSQNTDVRRYAKWVQNGPVALSDTTVELVRETGCTALTMPFMYLAGNLYDTSSGEFTPMAEDARPPDGVHRWLQGPSKARASVAIEQRLPVTPTTCTSNYPGLLSRMLGYLENGLCYQQICISNNLHYVLNSVRAPFLHALQASCGDRSRILQALHQAIGIIDEGCEGPNAVENFSYPKTKLGREPFLFALCLAKADCSSDILPAAYRLREQLTPLRQHMNEHGWDGTFNKTLTALLDRLVQREKIRRTVDADLRLIKVAIPGENLAWLYNPVYVRRKRFANSIRIVVDEYRKLYSVVERLEALVGKKSAAGA